MAKLEHCVFAGAANKIGAGKLSIISKSSQPRFSRKMMGLQGTPGRRSLDVPRMSDWALLLRAATGVPGNSLGEPQFQKPARKGRQNNVRNKAWSH
jgi:hypothetical protein